MKKPDLKALAKATKTYISEHEDNLTSKAGLVLVLTGAAVGIWAAIKCTHRIDNMQPDICECKACKEKIENSATTIYDHVRNNHPDMDAEDVMENTSNYFIFKHSFRQIGKVSWKQAIAPAVMMTAGSYGICRSDKKMLDKVATLTTTTTIAETLLSDYREEVKEEVGPEKEEKILSNAYAREIDRSWIEDLNPIDTGHGDEIFFDYWSGRYFLSNPDFIREKVMDLDDILFSEDEASMGDFYDLIDLYEVSDRGSSCVVGSDYGWNTDLLRHLKFVPTSKIVGSGHSVTVIGFSEPPQLGWSHFGR